MVRYYAHEEYFESDDEDTKTAVKVEHHQHEQHSHISEYFEEDDGYEPDIKDEDETIIFE